MDLKALDFCGFTADERLSGKLHDTSLAELSNPSLYVVTVIILFNQLFKKT